MQLVKCYYKSINIKDKKMINKSEIVKLEKQIVPSLGKALEITIKSSSDMVVASETLSKINKYADTVKDSKEKITKPLNESLKAVREMFKPLETKLSEAISCIRTEMSIYQTEQLRIAEIEKQKIASRIGDGKGKIKLETAINKMADVDTPDNKVSTDSGRVTFKTTYELVITDISKIPRNYLIPDEKMITLALKGGKSVGGCELKSIQTPVNFR